MLAADVPRHERGAALLTVLLIVAVVAVLATTALEKLRLTTRLAGNAQATEQVRAYANAAETMALVRIGSLLGNQPTRVTLAGGWSGRPFALPLPGGGQAAARVTDGGNCFNLNGLVARAAPGVYTSVATQRIIFARLLRLVGVPGQVAEQVASSTADWIDSDQDQQPGGAEDQAYLGRQQSYRTAGTLIADVSELRAIDGVTPDVYAKLRPWVCALPVAQPSRINLDTLAPEQAPLVAMLAEGLTVDQARSLLFKRPVQGFANAGEFWTQAQQPGGDGQAQTDVVTQWFALDIDVALGAAELHQKSLVDARRLPAQLVSRQWGEAS